MSLYQSAALLLALTALFGWFNERFLRLPSAIGSTLVALVASLLLLVFGSADVIAWAEGALELLRFDDLVLEGMLSFLLFAGALHVNWEDLTRQRWPVLALATVGVLVSTLLVATLVWLGLKPLGLELPFRWALVFGALISPTDPIAVLSLLRRLGVRDDVETLVVGESLFNDGVGVVVFLAVVALATGGGHGAEGPTTITGAAGTLQLFAREAIGGPLLGLGLGLLTFGLMRGVDAHDVEILLTLALVVGGYALALALHTSGPLAMVVAGLFIGNRGRSLAMSEEARKQLDTFWLLLDEILNAVLFVLIGLEVLLLFQGFRWGAALLAVPLVLAARSASVGGTISLLRLRRSFPRWTIRTMIWGGLRGGISVALALSLPAGPERDLLVQMTYAVVVFSILVQGLTVGRVAGQIPAADLDPDAGRA